MKKKFYQFFLFALTAGMMLPSCSSDEPKPEFVGPDGATAYAKVCITFPGSNRFGSRAFGSGSGEFENGSDAESEIKSLLFVFYDGDGRAVGHTTLTSTTIPPIPTPDPKDQNANVQDVYSVEVPVNLVPGSKKPTQVMCYANPQNTTDQYANLSEVYTRTRSYYYSADGFTMNNSVYYDGSNRVIATQIPAGGLKMEGETGDLAETTIYIERLAAKVSVNTASNFKVEPYEINSTTYLKFVPEWWSVTAVEQSTNLIKNLPAAYNDNSHDVQKFIKGANRTYWAHSLSYKDNDSFDPNDFPLTGWDIESPLAESTKKIKLKYLSYNDIKALRPAAEEGKDQPSWGGEQYFLETTGRSERLSRTDINGKLALPNAIIVGHYEVYSDPEMTTKKDGFNTDDGFYRYASDLYTKDNILAAMLSNHARYLRKAESASESASLTEADIKSVFSIKPVRKFYRNGVETDAALHYVAPQAEENTLIAGLQYYNGTEWVNVDADNIDAFNKFIVKQTNCAISYKEGGKAFFTVLVEHYGKVTEGTSSKEIEGSYGLVRNHTYKITVGKIAGLASGINDVTDPLLPMADEFAKFRVKAAINVLGWHVCTQKVDL